MGCALGRITTFKCASESFCYGSGSSLPSCLRDRQIYDDGVSHRGDMAALLGASLRYVLGVSSMRRKLSSFYEAEALGSFLRACNRSTRL